MPPRIRLQSRDLDILHSLGVGRYLTIQALEWLHIPSWRTRWQAHQEANGNGTAKRGYYPLPNLYRRLEGLRGGGYVMVIRRTVERATVVFNRLADVYALTEAGAELLAQQRPGVDLDSLVWEGQRPRALQNLEHTVSIALFYAVLRAELEYAFAERAQPLVLSEWVDDRRLAQAGPAGERGYDQVRAEGEDLPVLPDATFVLSLGERQRRYFLEVDRGTRPLDSWREKARAYRAYRKSNELQARYGVDDFALLIIAPTERRMERVAAQVVKVDQAQALTCRYLLVSQVHPTTMRDGWKRVAESTSQQRQIAGRPTDFVTVSLAPWPLWSVQSP